MPTCTIVFGTSQHFWTAISQHATLLKQWSILKVNISPAAALEQLAPEPFVHLSWIGPRQGRRHGRSQRASHCEVQFSACLSLKRLHMRWNLGPASFIRMAPGVARARAHTHTHIAGVGEPMTRRLHVARHVTGQVTGHVQITWCGPRSRPC